MVRRLGWGPFWGGWWPLWLWRVLFYDSRPDLVKSKTREQHWPMLKGELRFLTGISYYLGPPSHVFWNIKYPWLLVMAVTATYALSIRFNHDTSLMTMIGENSADIKDSFRYTSFVMSLVLAWRLNRGYERWWSARTSIAGVGSSALVFYQILATNLPTKPEDVKLLDTARRFCSIWAYAIKQVVSSAPDIDSAAAAYLFPEELAVYKSARKGRQLISSVLLRILANSGLDTQRYLSASNALQRANFAQGDCVRIKFQAMPQGLTSATSGFVLIWCLLIPFGLVTSVDDSVCPLDVILVGIVSLLLLSLDEVAAQLEDPFELMPLEEICAAYERDVNRVTSELDKMDAATAAGYAKAEEISTGVKTDPAVHVDMAASGFDSTPFCRSRKYSK